MDLYNMLLAKKLSGGGGDTPTLIDKTISANGTYNASRDNAGGYKKVVVNVSNSYDLGDEGKVVSNGALVAQTNTTKTENGTYDTTLNNSVTINVPSPTGNINITDTLQTDVSAYATAQIVDADLVAGNIKKDVNILGITGTYEGGGDAVLASLIDRSIESVVIPNGVKSIGGNVFTGCSNLQSVTIPTGVESIGMSAFSNCISLTDIVIPEGVTSIGDQAFYSITSKEVPVVIDLPSTITSIGSWCFRNNKMLRLYCRATTPPTVGSSAFNDTSQKIIYVPSESVDAYKASNSWSAYASVIQAISE